MSIAGADRIFAAALVVADQYRTFTATEIESVVRDQWDEDAPSRRTIYAHLGALAELGVLEEIGRSDSLRRYRFVERFDPSR
jgi:Fe2+ or Zn2+ uptake regulation protein